MPTIQERYEQVKAGTAATPAPTTPATPTTRPRDQGNSPSAAAAGAAMAQGLTPVVDGFGQPPTIGLANTASSLLKASSKTNKGNVQGALITLAEKALRASDDLRGKATAKAQAAQVREVQSVAKAFAAGIPRLASNELDVVMKSRNIDRQKGFRGRTGTPFANDRGFDPPTYIEIAQMPANQQATVDLSKIKSLGVKYNDFFITDSQETDAEKAEVSETFGAPHVFATGRYMRKVMISGVCRTGAVNPDILTTSTQLASMSAQDKGKYVVPHTLGLRVLYDKALRASEQIARSLFSRLVIDGEVYCGWFTTLNISRTGAEEGFAHFTMSMLVFARYHKDEDWAAKLLNTGSLPAKTAFTDAAATATLASMAGTMVIKLSASMAEVQQTVDETTTDELQFKSPLSLIISGNAQPVKVCVSVAIGGPSFLAQGFILKFGNTPSSRVPLDGSTTGVGTFDLVPAITDFAAFLQSVNSPGKTGKLNVPLTITLKPALGEVITTLTVNLVVNTVQTPKSAGMAVRIGTGQIDLPSNVNKEAKDIFQTPTTSAISLRFNVQNAAGNPLKMTQAMLDATAATLWDPEKDVTLATTGPKVEAKVGTLNAVEKADTGIASQAGAAKVTVGPVLTLLEEPTGLVELAVTFDYVQLGTNLKTVNPFVSAKDLVTSFRYKLKIGSFNEFLTEKVTIAARYAKSWVSSLIWSIKTVEANDSDITSITFNLNTTATSTLLPSKYNAVKQAIESIVSGSTFVFEGARLIGSAYSASTLNTAKVTQLTPDYATLIVPGSADDREPITGQRGRQVRLLITPPGGIDPITYFATAE